MTSPTRIEHYDVLTCEIERVEALLDMVIDQLNNSADSEYGQQVALECAREKLTVIRSHAKALCDAKGGGR